jgi:Zn-dependent protease with chaperone function
MLSAAALVAATLVLLPAILRWCWGRPLTRQPADPALPERLLASQRRNQITLALCIVGLIYLSPFSTLWTLPLLILARGLASYPLRRRLYGETWSVVAYLWFFGRLLVAVYGFWILLLITPEVAGRFGKFDWLAGIGLGAILVAWSSRAPDVIRWLLRVRPIADPALLPRFEQMARVACGTDLPSFEYVDLGGGAVANAVALPSLRRPGVLFTSTLLALLEPDEIAAICAHEIAHLEYYNEPRMRTWRLVNLGLIALAVTLAPLFKHVDPSLASFGPMLLAGVIGAVMIWRAKDRQKNETDSDLRAIALCGNAEALARGLEKLHAFARVPRRWDSQREHSATHPSLARRVRDIRAAAGIAPAPLATPSTFIAPDGRTSVAFENARVEWREGEGATHSLSYAHLSELRVQAPPSGAARLVAVERTGRRWHMQLRADDVAAIQAALDSVDSRLALVQTPRFSSNPIRVAALLGLSLSAGLGQLACAFVVMLTLAWQDSRLLAAAGVASLASALLVLREWMVQTHSSGAWMCAMSAATAVALFVVAHIRRRDETGPLAIKPLTALGAGSVLLVTFVALAGLDPIRLHQSVRATPGVVVLPLALACALMMDRRRLLRVAGLIPALLGVTLAGVGTLSFLDRAAHDPFLVAASTAAVRALDVAPAFELPVPFAYRDLRLSPSGRAVAVSQTDERDDDSRDRAASIFQIGRPGDRLQSVDADDIVFVDDDRALALDLSSGVAEIREIAVTDPQAVTWRERVPGVTSGALSVARGGTQWQLLGWTRGRHIVRAVGRVGGNGASTTEWAAPPNSYGWATAIAAAGDDALYVDTSFDTGSFGDERVLAVLSSLASTASQSRLWHLAGGARVVAARSRLDVSCTVGAFADAGLVCAAFDGARTRVVTIDARTAHITPVSTLWGRFSRRGTAVSGWLTGWLDSTPLALHLATNEVLEIAPRPREWIRAVSVTDGAIGTISSGGGASVIRIYRLEGRSAKR